MRHDELVSTFGQSVGVEKATDLITDALEDLEIERQATYSSHEVADICETISRANSGYLTVVANEVRVREQAKRRFDALLEQITDPVVMVSFDASVPVVNAVNPAFETTFGYGEDAVGRSLPALIVPEEQSGETVDEWFRSDAGSGTEIERVTADGDRRTFLFRPVIVSGFDGTIEGFGIYTDITERKRRERTLKRQNEQLERFVSVVSHDLRNPLSVADGNARLALQLTSESTVEERLEKLVAAHERMETLIDDLLTLASQGQAVDDPVTVRLQTVVEAAWDTLGTTAATLEIEVDDERRVRADDGRLRQLFENLFRNAIEHGSTEQLKATGNPDEPAEHATRSTETHSNDSMQPAVTIRVGWDNGMLWVEDDGPGIVPAERESVFDHGYTTSPDGTGFGLAIVEAIVDAHGWEIDVTESRDGGARFRLHGITGWTAPTTPE
ncbi:PAS domain S-box protein [Natronolimnobius sp. AArcel1]|uniref:PAS domain-containing sensor histidine kinase n=1 Tax=Natronolimnobius sp. AArcel1 TaxID=1679093 RepID=UPI0013EB0AD6|nr:PAS domain-containing sensor histidine kinase [Natronolimnobius sp. AArcel1]NGM70966.1 PAS domain S-box protein [Natronolimnobius sp. AArcel1]